MSSNDGAWVETGSGVWQLRTPQGHVIAARDGDAISIEVYERAEGGESHALDLTLDQWRALAGLPLAGPGGVES